MEIYSQGKIRMAIMSEQDTHNKPHFLRSTRPITFPSLSPLFPFFIIPPHIPLNSTLFHQQQLCPGILRLSGGSSCCGFQDCKITRDCGCLGVVAGVGKSCETLRIDLQNHSVSNTIMAIGWELITNSETHRNKFQFVDRIKGAHRIFTT